MSEKVWHSDRTDIPETLWDACVFLDKVKLYIRQVCQDSSISLDARQILGDAHGRVNDEYGIYMSQPYRERGPEFVSTYIPR